MSFPIETKEEGITSGTVTPDFETKVDLEDPNVTFYEISYFVPFGTVPYYFTLYDIYGGYVSPYYGE